MDNAAPPRSAGVVDDGQRAAGDELTARYSANRGAIVVERGRLEALADTLRTAGAPRPATPGAHVVVDARDDAVVGRVLHGCFHVARLVDKALAEDLLGERVDLDDDSFLDAARAQDTIDHLSSRRSVVHEWGEEELAALLGELDAGIALLTQLAGDDRQVLLFDPSGPGMIVEVFGELLVARHVAIVVPGMGTTVQNFEVSVADRARRLHRAASAHSSAPSVAVLAWLGYRAPGGLDLFDAAAERLAADGASALSTFVADLAGRTPSAHCSVVAHSYGSVVAGLAAHLHGLPVEDLVVLGSPGLGVAHASDLRLKPDGRVWAVRARHDPVTDVPSLQVGAVRLHGTSPYDVAFGCRIVAIDSEGHSSYLTGDDGVGVVARIVIGEDPR